MCSGDIWLLAPFLKGETWYPSGYGLDLHLAQHFTAMLLWLTQVFGTCKHPVTSELITLKERSWNKVWFIPHLLEAYKANGTDNQVLSTRSPSHIKFPWKLWYISLGTVTSVSGLGDWTAMHFMPCMSLSDSSCCYWSVPATLILGLSQDQYTSCQHKCNQGIPQLIASLMVSLGTPAILLSLSFSFPASFPLTASTDSTLWRQAWKYHCGNKCTCYLSTVTQMELFPILQMETGAWEQPLDPPLTYFVPVISQTATFLTSPSLLPSLEAPSLVGTDGKSRGGMIVSLPISQIPNGCMTETGVGAAESHWKPQPTTNIFLFAQPQIKQKYKTFSPCSDTDHIPAVRPGTILGESQLPILRSYGKSGNGWCSLVFMN